MEFYSSGLKTWLRQGLLLATDQNGNLCFKGSGSFYSCSFVSRDEKWLLSGGTLYATQDETWQGPTRRACWYVWTNARYTETARLMWWLWLYCIEQELELSFISLIQVAELVLVQGLFRIDFHPPWDAIVQTNFSMAMGVTSCLLLNPSLEN